MIVNPYLLSSGGQKSVFITDVLGDLAPGLIVSSSLLKCLENSRWSMRPEWFESHLKNKIQNLSTFEKRILHGFVSRFIQ